jgi:hypothetical protein
LLAVRVVAAWCRNYTTRRCHERDGATNGMKKKRVGWFVFSRF